MKDIKLEELKQSIASIQDEFKNLASAANDLPMEDKMRQHMSNMYDTMYRMNNAVYAYVDSVASNLYKHKENGHLPSMTPGQMNNALKVLGMDDSYEAKRHEISCAGKHYYIINAEFKK